MKIGYARISSPDQNLDMQVLALHDAGCIKIYKEICTGKLMDRPILTSLLETLRSGDTLYVWKLDRLGRSLKDLLHLVNKFNEMNIGFHSLNDPIETTTPQGRFIFNIFASLAEFERDLIRERTMAGIEAARARGIRIGKRKGLSEEGKRRACIVESLYREKKYSIPEIAAYVKICQTSVYKYLRLRNVPLYAEEARERGTYLK